MPKYKIICLLLAVVVAAVGTVLVISNLTGEDIPEFVKPVEDLNTYLDRTDDMDLDDPNADVREFLFVAHKNLLMTDGFYGVSIGSSSAVGVKQSVRNTRYVVGEFANKAVLKEMVTKGVVSKAYQLYMQDDNYIYRKGLKVNALDSVTWANTAQALSEDAFYNDFGHRNDKLTGYILNWDTVTQGEFMEKQDGVYTFRYTLDTVSSTEYLRREMIFNGNLNSEPSFSRCVIYVSMDADFNVKTLRTDCEYKAHTMGINATCTEDITEVFAPYQGELPEKDFFEQYFTSTPSDGIETEETALDVLLDMFSPYLNGEDLQVAFSARSESETIVSGLLSIEGLDIADLNKLTVNARVGNFDLGYVHADSAIYLKYKDFQASTTVNGVMNLVSTLTPLVGGDATSGLDFGDLDLEALLENLTFAVNGNQVVVSLPVSIGGVNIDAKLYGVVDGESYSFSYAVININDVSIKLAPNKWTVGVRSGAYPEILGLLDILQNGKLSLSASLTAGNYPITADALVDLASGNLQVDATLGNNGSINIVYVDGVAYLTFGEIKVRFDTEHIDELLEVIYKHTGVQLAMSTPDVNLPTQYIWYLLDSIKTTKTSSGVDFSLSMMDMEVALHLVNDDGSWQIGGITATMDGINLEVAPAEALGEVIAPAEQGYAEITELVDSFASPLMDIVRGNIYGANFNARLTINGKQYNVKGSVRVDINKSLKVNATVYDGNLGIIDAEVIYANDTVFMTLNGVKVAFAVGSGSDTDIVEKLSQLLDNEQIKEILDSRVELQQLVEQVATVIGVATADFDIADLLNVDFTTIVTAFNFENGVLAVSIDGGVFGIDGLALDLTLRNDDGCLTVGISGLEVAGVGLDVSATLLNEEESIAIPDTDEYMLTIAGELLNAELQVTIDLVHMDIWASVQVGRELLLVRYFDGKVYAQYGGAKVVVNVTELDKLVDKLSEVVGKLPETESVDLTKALAVISAIGSNLMDELPELSMGNADVQVSVNFDKSNGILEFNGITVAVTLNGKQYVAVISVQKAPAEQLDISQQFVDANAVIDAILDTVVAFKDCDGIGFAAALNLTVNGVKYDAYVNFRLNGGLYLNAVIKHGGTAVLNAEIYFVDGVLYCDVNGIRQAVEIPETNGNLDIATIIGALGQIEGLNEILSQLQGVNINADDLLDCVDGIAQYLSGVVFSEIIDDLTYVDGKLAISLDFTQFGLDKVTINVGLGDTLILGVSGKVANVAVEANVTLFNRCEVVVAPQLNSYVTELKVTVGSDVEAIVKLDLYHKTIVGSAKVYGQLVNFKYEGGVIYATYGSNGNVRFKLNVEDVDVLIAAIARFVELPAIDGNGNTIETAIGIASNLGFAKRNTNNGYVLEANYGDVTIAINFTADANKATFANVTVRVGDLTIAVEQTHGESYPELSANSNYVDIAELVQTFINPLFDIINGNVYGADFNATLRLSGKQYNVVGGVCVDLDNTLKLNVTLYDGNTGVIDAEVIYANNTVFLTLNGVKVAFAVGDSNVDIVEKLSELLNNDKVKEIINSREELRQLVEQATNVIGAITNFNTADLLDLDFSTVIKSFSFENGVLALSVDGSALGINGFALDITLANNDDRLVVSVGGLEVAGATLEVSATILNEVQTITVPNVDDYKLTLVCELMGAELQVTFDFVHMDIWASVQYGNELLLARYNDYKVYVQYGGAKLVVNVTELDQLVAKLGTLVELPETGSFDIAKILAVLASIDGSDWIGELPSISTQTTPAKKLDISQQFVDANAVIGAIVDTVVAFRDSNGIGLTATLEVAIGGVMYDAYVNFRFNSGLYLNAIFKNRGTAMLNAEIYFVDGVLYCDVNGIRQAVKIPETNGEMDVAAVVGAIMQLDGVDGMLAQLKSVNFNADDLLDCVKQLVESLNEVVFSDVIEDLTYIDGKLAISLDLTQFGFGKMNLTLGMGDSIAVDFNANVASVSVHADATVCSRTDVVTAPELDSYVTELQLSVGEDISATLKLDLYHNTIVGFAKVYGQNINFMYADSVVYATYGNVAVKLNIADIDDVLNAIARFVELPSVTMDGNGNIADTIMGVVSKFSVLTRFNGNGYALELGYDNNFVSVIFAASGNNVMLDEIEISAGSFAVTAKQVYNQTYPTMPTSGYLDIAKLASTFSESVANVVYAKGYDVGFNGSINFGGRVFGLNASLQMYNSNVHATFNLTYQNKSMIKDGELWIVDDTLYLQAGGLRFAIKLDTNSASSKPQQSLSETLESAKGYNVYVDKIVELVQSILNKSLDEIEFDKILTSATLANGVLTLGVDGSQFDLGNSITLMLNGNNGLGVSISGLQYDDVKVNITGANIVAYNREITAPTEDFSTNVKVVIDENNSLYAQVNLFDNVIKMKLVSRTNNGRATTLDLLYSINDNILKITDGKELHVSVDINSIANIVTQINKIVNEFAGADADLPLPGMGNMNSPNLKDIIGSLTISQNGNAVSVGLVALGMNVAANFSSGSLQKVTVPFTDDITLNVVPSNENIQYRDVPEDEQGYVRIDKVFDDFYYGSDDNKLNNDPHGPIYDLINTNAWKFDFIEDSTIIVTGDDGKQTQYQIAQGSFAAFYYNKTEAENTKVRAKLTVNRRYSDTESWAEFIMLDVAFIDGRIYASYDSNTKDTEVKNALGIVTGYKNSNVLRATVSVESIKECMSLFDRLVEVLQLQSVMDDLSKSMNQMQGSLTLGNLAAMFKYIGYSDNTFTMSLNSGIIDGLGAIDLNVTGEGSTLTLNNLTLDYNNKISVNLNGIQVSVSTPNSQGEYSDIIGYFADENSTKLNDGGKSTETDKYDPSKDHGYDMSNHMNFDSLYELMSALLVTAGNADNDGRRSFWVYNEKGINLKLTIIGIDAINLTIPVSLYADIDEYGNSFFALKLIRQEKDKSYYDDNGGNSYLLFDSKTGLFTIMRDSIGIHEVHYTDSKTVKKCIEPGCGADAEQKWVGLSRKWVCPNNNNHKVDDVTVEFDNVRTEKITGYESASNNYGEPGYIRKGITLDQLVANINTTEGECPLFELLNLGSINVLVTKINLENTIREQIGKPNDNVYGVEDVFKGYDYSAKKMQFTITVDLSPISSALGKFVLTIDHDGDYFLNNLKGDLGIASVITIGIDLNHVTPGFGYAQHFFVDSEGNLDKDGYRRMWTEWGGTSISYNP